VHTHLAVLHRAAATAATHCCHTLLPLLRLHLLVCRLLARRWTSMEAWGGGAS
jgi:hypothetical protein